MDTRFWNKSTLYSYVDSLRQHLLASPKPFPVDSKALASRYANNLIIEEILFPSEKICGILYRGDKSTSIALNAQRTPQMQNFDCMHELIHYFFHDITYCQLICGDSSGNGGMVEQDAYIEWQANEGSAQFLVPYQDFIPAYISLSREYAHDMFTEVEVCDILADRFFVSPKVILNRIDSLNYEIYNYLHGVPIPKVTLRSKSNLKKMNWDLQHKKEYCRNCLSPVANKHFFCPVCGNPLTDNDFWGRMKYINMGAGYVIYQGIELNSNGQPKLCPFCKNEEHLKTATHCMICGKPATNQCTFALQDNVPSEYRQCAHLEPLPGNARYCPYCGAKTTFFESELLRSWDRSFAITDEDIPY